MKSKISYLIAILLGVMAITFNSCEEKDDYNYNNIEPIIFSMAGPATTPAHGFTEFPVRYSVPQRGGSTYAWTIGGHGGTFVQDTEFPSIIYATFTSSTTSTTATVTVVETTQGGKQSEPFIRTVNLTPFCAIPEEFFGNYLEFEDGYTYEPVSFAADPTDPSGVIITGIQGSWIPPGGKIKINLDYCTGNISFVKQGTGLMHPVYGQISLEPSVGTQSFYDTDTGTVYLFTRVTVAAGSFGDWIYEFTKL